jgi:hypothetical protein
MKTSNYIIIAYLTCLFGGIFVLFLAAKVDSTHFENPSLETLEQPLGSFSMVVAESGAKIKLKQGTTSKIMTAFPKGKASKLPPFIVRNDTLFVGADPNNDQQPTAQITYRQINGIFGEEQSRIDLDQFATDTFSITIRAGKLFCFSNYPKPVKSNLNIKASKGAYIQIHSSKIQDLNLSIDHSELNIQNTNIDKLSGTMNNGSKFTNFASIYKLNLEVDSTSTYSMNKR